MENSLQNCSGRIGAGAFVACCAELVFIVASVSLAHGLGGFERVGLISLVILIASTFSCVGFLLAARELWMSRGFAVAKRTYAFLAIAFHSIVCLVPLWLFVSPRWAS
ncbi:hypothetical protein [Dyella tabacisoli]|uniref:hypothetical protein n=1 Tax=Dyella tabacisoli TaxID=2282381 RepID=UPI0013B36DC4|nr:hypothetical protein [Dyella tabacisoli]